jgi:hypothetical protein
MKQIGPYEVISEIGRGAMGLVYELGDFNLWHPLALARAYNELGRSDYLVQFKATLDMLERRRVFRDKVSLWQMRISVCEKLGLEEEVQRYRSTLEKLSK